MYMQLTIAQRVAHVSKTGTLGTAIHAEHNLRVSSEHESGMSDRFVMMTQICLT